MGTRYLGIAVGRKIAEDRVVDRETCWQRSLREALKDSKSCDTGAGLAGELEEGTVVWGIVGGMASRMQDLLVRGLRCSMDSSLQSYCELGEVGYDHEEAPGWGEASRRAWMVAVAGEGLGRSRCAADTGLRADRQAGAPSEVDMSIMRVLG